MGCKTRNPVWRIAALSFVISFGSNIKPVAADPSSVNNASDQMASEAHDRRRGIGHTKPMLFADETKVSSFCLDLGNISSSTSDVIVAAVGQFSANHFISFAPAREAEIYITLTIDDPTVATFGENGSDTLVLTIVPGVTRSPTYDLKAHKIGKTFVTATFSDTGSTESLDVVTWDLVRVADYNNSGFEPLACYDPTNVPQMTAETADKATCGTTIFSQVAADGASLLSYQIAAGGEGLACFEIIDDGDSTNGSAIENAGEFFIGGSPGTSAESVMTDAQPFLNKHWAFGTYSVADGVYLPGKERREIRIGIGFNPPQKNGSTYNTNATSTIERELTISRPPALLVHGVFSNSGVWDGFVRKWPGQTQIIPYNYEPTNDYPFTENATRLKDAIFREIVRARYSAGGTVISRVNIIAHSMGGLVTRTLLADPVEYRLPTNLNKGTVNRVATLGTPHDGSLMGSLVAFIHAELDNAHTTTVTAIDPISGALVERVALTNLAIVDAVVDNAHYGALCDLAENSSAVKFDAVGDVRGRAVSGSAGDQTDLTFPMSVLRVTFTGAEEALFIDPYFYRIPNDGSVSTTAAAGSFDSEFVIDYPDLFHSRSFSPVLKRTVVDDSVLINNLAAAFDDSSSWQSLSALPGSHRPTSLPDGVPYDGGQGFDSLNGVYPDELAYIESCISPGYMNVAPPPP